MNELNIELQVENNLFVKMSEEKLSIVETATEVQTV
jgi:hypothetical protein